MLKKKKGNNPTNAHSSASASNSNKYRQLAPAPVHEAEDDAHSQKPSVYSTTVWDNQTENKKKQEDSSQSPARDVCAHNNDCWNGTGILFGHVTDAQPKKSLPLYII